MSHALQGNTNAKGAQARCSLRISKKIVSALIAFALCFASVPATAFAAVGAGSNGEGEGVGAALTALETNGDTAALTALDTNGDTAALIALDTNGDGDAGDGGSDSGDTGDDEPTTYPYKSGYVQIENIYAFDAATYPYGDYTTCGGYDYDNGAWTQDTPTITKKGAQLQFEARGTFVSGNMDDPNTTPTIDSNITMDGSDISWSVNDTSLATIDFQSGLFTPHSNGTVQVTATVYGSRSYTEQEFSVTFDVEIDINESAYITNLTIVAPDKATEIGGAQEPFDLYQYLVDTTGEEDFKTLAATTAPQFYVNVEVYDPASDATETYLVRSGTELSEACGISDLSWGQVSDSYTYSIDATTGMLRMLYESTVVESIRVYTTSTEDGSYLDSRASLVFTTQESGGSDDESGYVPSDTLTVMAYYEKDPADVNDPTDKYWLRLTEHDDATSITYSLSDLQAISVREQAYTMISGNKSCQAIATGVNLQLLLQDALGSNISIDDIAGFYFKTFDEGYMPGQYFVSASMVFADRYFFPYYFQGGDCTGATQVYPILAWNSKLYWSDKYPDINVEDPSTWDRDAMSSASRYRLIFGAQSGDWGVTKSSVYCIQTMYVVLKGGMPVSDGTGDDDDSSHKGGGGESDGGGSGEGEGESGGSGGTAGPSDDPQGGSSTTDGSSSGNEANEDAAAAQGEEVGAGSDKKDSEAAPSDEATDDNGVSQGTTETRKQSVYQVMSTKELAVKMAADDTLGWALVPLGALALGAGVAYALLWFRRQTAPLPVGAVLPKGKE